MPNQSKIESPRFWGKWRNSGAIGTMPVDPLAPIRGRSLSIDGITPLPYDEKVILGLGGRIVEQRFYDDVRTSFGFQVSLEVVVNQREYTLGQRVSLKDIPEALEVDTYIRSRKPQKLEKY
jgi:hypothetical protein